MAVPQWYAEQGVCIVDGEWMRPGLNDDGSCPLLVLSSPLAVGEVARLDFGPRHGTDCGSWLTSVIASDVDGMRLDRNVWNACAASDGQTMLWVHTKDGSTQDVFEHHPEGEKHHDRFVVVCVKPRSTKHPHDDLPNGGDDDPVDITIVRRPSGAATRFPVRGKVWALRVIPCCPSGGVREL
eukprot:TRINITY_DN1380_c0_g1_i1.p1 TRINITY_DN1380_c0_g1~~TRINITY_DN1380_c0_g1_i1.p1  ORF type:complete len:182 (-),score=5.97 TRINITY_DN1380_c0_g1_i1:54-599(-)